MNNKPDKKVKSVKKAKKKTVNFNNFKVDFDLNLNKSFNTNDLLKKKLNIMPNKDLKKSKKIQE
jgi:hypothetical protein